MEGVVLVDDDNRRNSIVLMKHRRQVKQRGRKLHFTDLALRQVLIELPAVHIALVACPISLWRRASLAMISRMDAQVSSQVLNFTSLNVRKSPDICPDSPGNTVHKTKSSYPGNRSKQQFVKLFIEYHQYQNTLPPRF